MAKEKELIKGLALVWDDRGCETKEQKLDSLVEFLEYSFNCLKKHYQYTHFVFAFKTSEKDILNEFPSCVGVCRGSEEVLALNEEFTKFGLFCTTERIMSVEKRIKLRWKEQNNTRRVHIEKIQANKTA